MFVAIAAGMSAPYFLLSAQPAWLRFCRKPGAWMERVKQLMGFLLFATLLFLLCGPRRATRSRCDHLDRVLFCSRQPRLLDERRIPPATASALRASSCSCSCSLLLLGSGWYFIGEKFAPDKLAAADA